MFFYRNKIGSQIFKATISGAERENTYNNTKFCRRVIDQKKNRSSNSDKSS
jgi:hypothetical protein